MGIFSRFKDIISSNINAMLDKAEDPEKMIRLMLQEMEETLVELKSSCAGIMADRKKAERNQAMLLQQVQKWQSRAELAVTKEKEDLAREALIEKNLYQKRADHIEEDMHQFDTMIKQAQEDITQLEGKIATAREKQQLLIKRHIRADQKLRTQKEIRRAGSLRAFERFEEFEQKIDRLEAEAGLVNPAPTGHAESIEEEFTRLEHEDTIDNELQILKKKQQKDTKDA